MQYKQCNHFVIISIVQVDDLAILRPLVLRLLTDHGQTLVQAIMNACVFSLPSYMLADSAEVLFKIMLADRKVLHLFL